ncbi:MAG TPA: LysM peptidoglycan-binding domain-containing protein [Enteractinococcus helveticum]|uniref:LysM peptidoglycan-binding domain-containing protein n=1 Tax=Enteractinococcus helveticum TaxID=1837282 RepID=A0A921FMY6_9MICC|nr:lytic transglycosylase domain-containing protein [Enteractinococcus helveticum]HJF14863.1 LysM peptidoglycan-binding domain-containing protein [Enteractinococcus helveticum]
MTDRTSGASRFYKSAVATSALPLLALGSATAATAAVADAPSTAFSPKPATAANLIAAQQQLEATLIPADQVAVALPARFTQDYFQAAKAAPKTYKVESGDTLGHIALKHKVSLSSLLKWNDLKASSTIYPGDELNLGPASSNSSTSTSARSTSSSSSDATYKVKAGDTLSAIAARNGISLSTLLKANGLSMSSVIYPGQSLKLSGSASSSSSSTSKTSKSSSSSGGSTYKVRSGDTLSGIAAKNDVSLSTLLNANGLSRSSIIYPGQQLKLSGSASNSSSSTKSTSSSRSSSSYTVKAGDTLSSIAARNGVSLSTILKANGLSLSSTIFPGQNIKLSGGAASSSSSSGSSSSSSNKVSKPSSASTYTVKAGDTLSGIAAGNGVSLSTILKANGLSSSSIIYPGQKLKLSGSTASSNSSGSSSSSSSGSSKTSGSYTVKSGDTLSGIASRNGVSLSTLLQANGLSASSIIYAGQTLKLSGNGGSSSMTTASSGNNEQLIGNTFLHYTYPDHVVANANANKSALLAAPMPSTQQVRQMVSQTASQMGVDPKLALAHAQVESGFNPTAVSPANAIGTMQVIPSSGEWASQLVGRKLNLLDPQDNITAGVAIIRHLQRNNPGDIGIAGYYQGEGGVRKYGMYPDTKDYVSKVRNAMSRF